MLGICRKKLLDMRTRGLLPDSFKPVRTGERNDPTLWRANEIRDWITAGMPTRAQWVWEPSVAPTYKQLAEIARAEYIAAQEQANQAAADLARLQEEVVELQGKRDELARMVADLARR